MQIPLFFDVILQADQFVKASTSGKLKVIVDQVRHLQQMALKILQDAQDNTRLHHAACNFHKVPGQIYHLYKRASGQVYFSMLSPAVRKLLLDALTILEKFLSLSHHVRNLILPVLIRVGKNFSI